MQDRDHRDPDRGQDVHDVCPVASAEDAVLVLDDRDVEGVECLGGGAAGAGLGDDQLVHDQRLGRLRAVDDPHHTDVGAGVLEMDSQRLGESGQAALRWGIGGEDAETQGHEGLPARGDAMQPSAAVLGRGLSSSPGHLWPVRRCACQLILAQAVA